MRPSFMGINIARSALITSQQQLDVTSHNIANASVEGYSRQRLDVQAAPDAHDLGGYLYPGTVGQGIQATQLERLRNQFLDREFRLNQQEQSFYQTQAEYLERMEAFLGELGDTGLGEQLDRFFNAWQEVSLRPEDLTLRRNVVEVGKELAFRLQSFVDDVTRIQEDTSTDLRLTVDRMNAITTEVAQLNEKIALRHHLGETPADLLDQRDRLLNELSELSKIQVTHYDDQTVQVQIDGKAVVFKDISHDTHIDNEPDLLRGSQPIGFPNTLNAGDLIINGIDILGGDPPITVNNANDIGLLLNQINQRSPSTGVRATVDPAGHLQLSATTVGSGFIQLQATGVGLNLTSIPNGNYTLTDRTRLRTDQGSFINVNGGKAQALFETKTQAIPATLDRIHQLTAELVRQVNSVHSQAFDLQGQTGRNFFSGTNPRDIAVNTNLDADPRQVALAQSNQFPPGDGSQGLAISQLRFSAKVGGENLEDYYRTTVTDMGIRINRAQERNANLERIVQQIIQQRESVSGVNLDEELANMLQYQRSFSAAARLMNTLDEMMALVVNGLGLVGR